MKRKKDKEMVDGGGKMEMVVGVDDLINEWYEMFKK